MTDSVIKYSSFFNLSVVSFISLRCRSVLTFNLCCLKGLRWALVPVKRLFNDRLLSVAAGDASHGTEEEAGAERGRRPVGSYPPPLLSGVFFFSSRL